MPANPTVVILNQTRGTVICHKAEISTTMLSGLRGLLGRKCLEPGGGLLIRPSSGIHTWFMQFPIDVVALDRHLKVTGVWHHVKPYRICALNLRTSSVLELPSGQIRFSGTLPGDQLVVPQGNEH